MNASRGRLFVVPNLLGLVPPANVLPQLTMDIARGLTHFVVETPKAARQFLKGLEPARPLQELHLSELNEHTRPSQIASLLAPAIAGNDIGLVSDAGCPGVADPGAALVAAAHDAGINVVPLVGPSAVLLALMASGMNGQAFVFHGYLSSKPAARDDSLAALDRAAAGSGATQLFIETPYRNDVMVDSVLRRCSPARRFCVAVDLTLPSEQILSRTVAAWRRTARTALGRRPAMFLLGR